MTDFPYPSHLIGTRGARWFYEHLVEVTALRPAEAFGFLRELADELDEGQSPCITRTIEVAAIAQVAGRIALDYWQDKTGVDVDKALAPLRMPVASLTCADDLAAFDDALGARVRYKLFWAVRFCESVRIRNGSSLELAIYAGRFDRLFAQRHK
jgi:hypothetical protein